MTTFPETKGVDAYKDLTPRGGVAYDVFGNGKTAVKVSFGRYLEAAQNAGLFVASRPTSRVSTTATRTWTDSNGNFVPDCDLLNNAAQDLRPSGGDFCGAVANTNFGKSVFDTTQDPALFSGWGVRAGDWQYGVSVQQQLMARVSVEVGYYRRWLNNFIVTDNLTVAANNYDPFTISAPVDSRLPNGGGYAIPGPLFNINPSVASSATNNFVTLASNYGDQTQTSNSISLNLSARPRNGLVFQGGFNTAQTSADYCDIRAAMPELTVIGGRQSPTNPYCKTNTGFITRFTALGSYTIPKIDVQIAGTVRSDQGDTLAANWAVPNAVIAPSLGRNLSNNAQNVDGEPDRARDAVRRSPQRDRSPLREDSAVRPHADERRHRHLQHHEQRAGADLQPDVRAADGGEPEGQLVDAEFGAAAALLQDQRAVRLLIR